MRKNTIIVSLVVIAISLLLYYTSSVHENFKAYPSRGVVETIIDSERRDMINSSYGNNNSSNKSGGSALNGLVIAGIVIGCIIGFIILIMVIAIFFSK